MSHKVHSTGGIPLWCSEPWYDGAVHLMLLNEGTNWPRLQEIWSTCFC